MKKSILLSSVLFSVAIFAGESNSIAISDLKEATYHLILDTKKIKSEQDALRDETAHAQETLIENNNNFKKEAENTLSELKKKAVYIKSDDDKYDTYIKNYVSKNEATLTALGF